MERNRKKWSETWDQLATVYLERMVVGPQDDPKHGVAQVLVDVGQTDPDGALLLLAVTLPAVVEGVGMARAENVPAEAAPQFPAGPRNDRVLGGFRGLLGLVQDPAVIAFALAHPGLGREAPGGRRRQLGRSPVEQVVVVARLGDPRLGQVVMDDELARFFGGGGPFVGCFMVGDRRRGRGRQAGRGGRRRGRRPRPQPEPVQGVADLVLELVAHPFKVDEETAVMSGRTGDDVATGGGRRGHLGPPGTVLGDLGPFGPHLTPVVAAVGANSAGSARKRLHRGVADHFGDEDDDTPLLVQTCL